MSMLFTGEVAVPNIAAGIDKLAPVLQNAGALELKKRKAQAAAIKEAHDNRAKIAAQQAGLYSDSHPFVAQYMDQATDGLTALLEPYLHIPGGSEYSKQIIENFKLAAQAYKLNPELTTADQDMGAMTDPSSQAFKKYNASLGSFYKPSVSIQQHTAAMVHQYDGLLEDVKVEWSSSSPGAFSLTGYPLDANGDRLGGERVDIKSLSSFNNKHAFDPETVMVSPSTPMIMGTAIRAKEMASGRPYEEAGVTERYADHHTNTLRVEDMEEDNEIFQYRYMAMLQGEDEIREKTGFTGSQEDLFALFSLDPRMEKAQQTAWGYVQDYLKRHWTESMIPMIEYENDADDDGKGSDSIYAAGVVGKEPKIPALSAGQEVEVDEDGQPVDQDETFVDMPGLQGEGERERAEESEEKVNTATFNLRAHKSKLWDEIAVMAINPEYAKYSEEDITALKQRSERIPLKEIPFKIDEVVFRQDKPGEVEITLFGTEESYILDLNATDPESTGLKALFEAGFVSAGVTWAGLWKASKDKWESKGQGDDSIKIEMTKVDW